MEHWPDHKSTCRKQKTALEEIEEVIVKVENQMKTIQDVRQQIHEKIVSILPQLYREPRVSWGLAHAATMRRMADIRSVVVIILDADDISSSPPSFAIPESKPFCFQIIDSEFQKMLDDGVLMLGKLQNLQLDLRQSAASLRTSVSRAYEEVNPKMVPVIITAKDRATGEFIHALNSSAIFTNNIPECGFVYNFPIRKPGKSDKFFSIELTHTVLIIQISWK